MCNKKNIPPPPRGMIGPRVNMVSRMARRDFNQVVSDEGLFAGQHHIIMILHRKGSATISQIAEEIGNAPATVSVSIKRLEKAGFVEKKPSESDGRITEIQLTQKALNVTERIKNKMEKSEDDLVKSLSEEERNTLSDLLDKIIFSQLENKEKEECANA